MTATELSVTEAEIERFFGVEPVRSDAEISWPYNRLLFIVDRDRAQVIFDFSPSYKHVDLTVHMDGKLIYQLSAPALENVRMHPDPSHETLELVVSERDRIFLRLAPSVLITQQTWDGS